RTTLNSTACGMPRVRFWTGASAIAWPTAAVVTPIFVNGTVWPTWHQCPLQFRRCLVQRNLPARNKLRQVMECGGKRSATPLWLSRTSYGGIGEVVGRTSQSAVDAALCRRSPYGGEVVRGSCSSLRIEACSKPRRLQGIDHCYEIDRKREVLGCVAEPNLDR